jgi:hypothetical protein
MWLVSYFSILLPTLQIKQFWAGLSTSPLFHHSKTIYLIQKQTIKTAEIVRNEKKLARLGNL